MILVDVGLPHILLLGINPVLTVTEEWLPSHILKAAVNPPRGLNSMNISGKVPCGPK